MGCVGRLMASLRYSNTNQLSLIASETNHNDLIVKDKNLWEQLLEISNEKR
jgi:hypothetical protein